MLYHHCMASLPIVVIDAFTARPFKGNPAAVCLLADPAPPRTDAWMQSIAAEMNLSETAFLVPQAGGFNLRWFTPLREVDLCGHATLASAHFLWESGSLGAGDTARFHTRSGLLTATRHEDWIELDFPTGAPQEVETPSALQVALGENTLLHVAQNKMDLLVEIESEAAVRALQPNMERLASMDVRGVIVTAQSSSGYDFVSRCFYPRVGIPEDPVTGSAHTALAPYWAQKLGKQNLLAYQASARGGELRLQVEGDRVKIAGQAVTVWRGTLVAGLS